MAKNEKNRSRRNTNKPPKKANIEFVGSSLEDLRNWPKEAKMEAGYQLDNVQRGNPPDDWKPMKSVGLGVREIRIEESDRAWRVMYVHKIEDTVHVLHCFQKSSQKTERSDIDIAKKRLKAIKHDTK